MYLPNVPKTYIAVRIEQYGDYGQRSDTLATTEHQ